MSRKIVEVLTVIHMGNYDESGKIINDSCPCCAWAPPESKAIDNNIVDKEDAEWVLGRIWAPGSERGIGAYFQVYHCQQCGLVYATHIN